MKLYFTFLICLLCMLTINEAKVTHHVWPHPQQIHQSEHFHVINSSDFTISTTFKCDLIVSAIQRIQNRMFAQDCSKLDYDFKGKYIHDEVVNYNSSTTKNYVGILRNLSLKLKDGATCEKYPQFNMDEQYLIKIEDSGLAEIQANSVWGILRGLETFGQLMDNVGRNQFVIHSVELEDYPRFAHRGLMIDTSRHFLSVKSILGTLDAMEMNKLNVLHWHVVDDQSFPFESINFPELAHKGAYNSKTHVYHRKDVETVIEHARERGIRVLAEFDTPGHSLSWGRGIPNLLTPCYDKEGKLTGEQGPIDPSLNSTYDFLKKFFQEVSQRLPDQYIHLGGDEVDSDCWEKHPKITEFMKQMHFELDQYEKLESYYLQKVVDIVGHQLNKSYIVWQEVLDEGVVLRKDGVVHIWIEKNKQDKVIWPEELAKVTKLGHRALLSAPWYLDSVDSAEDWMKFYQIEPQNFHADSEDQKKLLLGGEACMWGATTYVDGANLASRIWPTTSAVAERLWSSSTLIHAEKAKMRFEKQRCRMQMLGIRAAPLVGPGYCQCDHAWQ